MGTLTRKQREVQQREQMLLGIARKMLIEQGYAGLSMDRLAEATEYSKGTVYQHFSTKEDLVTALSVESNEHRLALFDRARQFQGRPRERMLAIGVADELFAKLHSHYYRSEQVIRLADLEIRASTDRRETLIQQDCRVIDWIMEIVQEGIDVGDLSMGPGQSKGTVVFAVLSLAIGTPAVLLTYPHAVEKLKIIDPFQCLQRNIHAFFDGLGWRPLLADWDYAETYQRIRKEIFADECRRAGLV